MIPFGIFWLCVGKAVYDVIAFTFNCYYTKKILNYGLIQQTKEVLPIIINGIIMVVAVRFAMMPFASSWAKLGVGIIVGAASFLSFAIITRSEPLFYAYGLVKGKLMR